MMCKLCRSELTQPESQQFGLCYECRHWPGQNTEPASSEQHDQAVDLVTNIFKATTVEAGE